MALRSWLKLTIPVVLAMVSLLAGQSTLALPAGGHGWRGGVANAAGTQPYRYEPGVRWYLHLWAGTDLPDTVVAVRAAIYLAPDNAVPTDTTTYIANWVGTDVAGRPAPEGFVQIGYKVDARKTDAFAYTYSPRAVRCLDGTSYSSGRGGVGCYASLATLNMEIDHTYTFEIVAFAGSVFLQANGVTLMQVDDPAPRGLNVGYVDAEVSNAGEHSLSDLAARGLKIKSAFPRLEYLDLTSGRFVQVPRMYAYRTIYGVHGGRTEGGAGCPAYRQAAGVFGTRSFYVAGSYDVPTSCVVSGMRLS